ncbi:MAG: hypothetical protein MHM6MM_003831, partial [Cercozoa sp. M6MM]
DGWDRTSQLCSLIQILLDPFYRTLAGLRVLVYKDWLAFGHQFQYRSGDVAKRDERSPIFLQFLDCLYQLVDQFPDAFAFNTKLVADLATHSHSQWFGDFLCNTQQQRLQRLQIQRRSYSMWQYLHTHRSKYLNPQHKPAGVLTPVTSAKLLRLWNEYYLRYNEVFFRARVVDLEESDLSDHMDHQVLWVPDDFASQCAACTAPFSFWRRKSHCRLCGQLFCAKCVEKRLLLAHLNYPPNQKQKVCDSCFKRFTHSEQ